MINYASINIHVLLYVNMFLILLDIYFRVKMLSHVVAYVKLYEEQPEIFKKQMQHFLSLLVVIREIQFLCIFSNTIFFYFCLNIIIAKLVEVKWYLIVVLVCISPMNNNFTHFFIVLLTNWISLEKCLFQSYTHLLNELFIFFH